MNVGAVKLMQTQSAVAFFTIASRNYISHVRVWRQSLAEFHPGSRVILVLVDEPFDDDHGLADTEVVLARDILGDQFDDMALRYDVLELNTAVKAESFRYIFDRCAEDRIVYLDPDTVLYARLDTLVEPLERGASAVVTPHVLQPLADERRPNDLDLLRSGTFNLGFLALRISDEALSFLDWWSKRLRFQCFSAVGEGLFTDQKWCDLLPSFVPSFAVSRQPGANVAYWNVHHRPISRDKDGRWLAAGEPLLFFHYSGFSVENPGIVSRHQDRLTWNDLGPAQELFLDYQRRLMEQGWAGTHQLPYAYDKLNDVSLSTPIRRLYARLYPEGLSPAAVAGLNIERLCRAPEALIPQFRGLEISALAAQLFAMRPDLQSKFAVRTPWGRWRFRRWLRRHAVREYRIPNRLFAK